MLARSGNGFVRRWFTEAEIRECVGDAASLAGRFAAKEAVWKALSLDSAGPASWRSVEVLQCRGRLEVSILPPLEVPIEVSSIAVDMVVRDAVAVAIAIATTG